MVSIVAHSQGCLISLLAQAFLLDEGKRPADTLILTHPPYSLVEETTMFFGTIETSRTFGGGKDTAMDGQYEAIDNRQSFHARLQTLVQKQRQPLRELGAGFYQRVFTGKQRLDPAKKTTGPVLVGLPPHDFALRLDGEDDHAHVAGANRGHRASHDEAPWPPVKPSKWNIFSTEAGRREGLRTINGEALRVPKAAVLDGDEIRPGQFPATSSQATLPRKEQGPCEEVDPIDAAIAITSSKGLRQLPQEIVADPRPVTHRIPGEGNGFFGSGPHHQVQQAWNLNKHVNDQCRLIRISRYPGGGDQLFVIREETPNEARKRWQHEVSPKSFHGAIIGNAENHRHVTAYDVAIGGGKEIGRAHV